MQRPRLLLILLLFTACSSAKNGQSRHHTGQPPPADFQLEVGEGGGFTGMWSGYVINSTGVVERLSGRRPNEGRVKLGELPSDSLHQIWNVLLVSGVLDEIPESTTGNLTRSLTVVADGRRVQVSWVESRTTSNRLDELYARVMKMISREFPE